MINIIIIVVIIIAVIWIKTFFDIKNQSLNEAIEEYNELNNNTTKNNNEKYLKNINKNINTIKWILLLPIISNIILIIIFISLINK